MIFDACRNELNLIHNGIKGLAFKGFVPNAFLTGVMVAYATAPGKTAADVGHDSGPYARALVDEIDKPVEAMTMFRNVALRVHRDIGQDPWMTTSTLPEVYFAKVPTTTTAPSTMQPTRRQAKPPPPGRWSRTPTKSRSLSTSASVTRAPSTPSWRWHALIIWQNGM